MLLPTAQRQCSGGSSEYLSEELGHLVVANHREQLGATRSGVCPSSTQRRGQLAVVAAMGRVVVPLSEGWQPGHLSLDVSRYATGRC